MQLNIKSKNKKLSRRHFSKEDRPMSNRHMKDVYQLLEKSKSELQWDITWDQSEWPSKNLQTIHAGEDVEKRERSPTVLVMWNESVSPLVMSDSLQPWTVAHQAPPSMGFSR